MKMKVLTKTIIVLCLLFFAVACKKDVPSHNLNYIGTWLHNLGGEYEEIIIYADGRANYDYAGSDGTLQISGKIFFDGDNFRIKKGRNKKGFITYVRPTKNVVSQNPYKFYYSAVFNEKLFIRQD